MPTTDRNSWVLTWFSQTQSHPATSEFHRRHQGVSLSCSLWEQGAVSRLLHPVQLSMCSLRGPHSSLTASVTTSHRAWPGSVPWFTRVPCAHTPLCMLFGGTYAIEDGMPGNCFSRIVWNAVGKGHETLELGCVGPGKKGCCKLTKAQLPASILLGCLRPQGM